MTKNIKQVIEENLKTIEQQDKQEIIKLIQKLGKNIGGLKKPILTPEEEKQLFEEAGSFLENEFKIRIKILWEQEAEEKNRKKAVKSLCGKPSILVE